MKKIKNNLQKINYKLFAIYMVILEFIELFFSPVSVFATTVTDPGYIPKTTVKTSANFLKTFTDFYKEKSIWFNFLLGIVLLTNIVIFIYHFCKLGATATLPQERAKTIHNILISGLCLALTGIINLIYVILFYIIK